MAGQPFALPAEAGGRNGQAMYLISLRVSQPIVGCATLLVPWLGLQVRASATTDRLGSLTTFPLLFSARRR